MTSKHEFSTALAEGILPKHVVTHSQPFVDVRCVMSRDVATTSPDETVASAARIMTERNISCIIVLENESVVGILTEKDLLKNVAAHQGEQAKTEVGQIMSRPVEGIDPDLSIFDACIIIKAKGFKHLPVLENGRLVGIVTQTDLTKALTSYSVHKSIAEIMSPDVATVQCKATVLEAAKMMSSRNISCIVVLQGSEVTGILTQRDLIKQIVATQREPAKIRVEQVMSSPIISTPSVNSIFSVSKIMERMRLRRLAVMDDGCLCGIVTQTNVFDAAKEEMQEKEKQNLQLLERSEYGIYTAGLDGKTTYVNPALMKMLEVQHSEELVDQPFLPELFWDNPGERATFIHEMKEAGYIKGDELTLRNSEGERVYVSLVSTLTRDSSGQVNGSQGILCDITERKRAAEEFKKAHQILREQDRLKSEFISMVSHELRTPLTAFKNIISNTMSGCFGKIHPKLRENLEIADKNINRLAKIIREFLDIFKIEAGKMKLDFAPVSLQLVISEVIGSLMPLAADKNIELKCSVADSRLLVNADRGGMVQVLMILIGNAIKCLPEDSHISVSARENDNKVYVEVVDDGPGIGKEDIDKVFDRSVQVKKIISPGEHGTGLGLSIAKELIEMHGGHIWVKSTPGAGTTFSFVLPKCLEESEREK